MARFFETRCAIFLQIG